MGYGINVKLGSEQNILHNVTMFAFVMIVINYECNIFHNNIKNKIFQKLSSVQLS